MDTKQIKKEAIAKLLGHILTGCCKYSPNDPTAWGDSMEPDIPALGEFVNIVGYMAKCHLEDNLSEFDLNMAEDFVRQVGQRCHHIWSDGTTTGTWGVRLQEIGELREIVNLGEFSLPEIGTEIEMWGYKVMIVKYEVTENWVVVTYHYDNGEYGVQEWGDVIYWNKLEKFAKGEK